MVDQTASAKSQLEEVKSMSTARERRMSQHYPPDADGDHAGDTCKPSCSDPPGMHGNWAPEEMCMRWGTPDTRGS